MQVLVLINQRPLPTQSGRSVLNEHRTHIASVGGSNPTLATKKIKNYQQLAGLFLIGIVPLVQSQIIPFSLVTWLKIIV